MGQKGKKLVKLIYFTPRGLNMEPFLTLTWPFEEDSPLGMELEWPFLPLIIPFVLIFSCPFEVPFELICEYLLWMCSGAISSKLVAILFFDSSKFLIVSSSLSCM